MPLIFIFSSVERFATTFASRLIFADLFGSGIADCWSRVLTGCVRRDLRGIVSSSRISVPA
jgi:hypothetical protein